MTSLTATLRPAAAPPLPAPTRRTARDHAEPVLETNMALRAAAILAVVASHAQLADLQGGAYFLLALAGYNFRRFKLPAWLRDGSPWPATLRYHRKLLVPYGVAVLAYFAWKGVFEADVLLLYSNLLRTDGTAIFPIWFIQVLFQCTLVLAALFALAPLRALAAARPFAFSLGFLAVSVAVAALSDALLDLHSLHRRTPLWMMALVALGWTCASVTREWQRLLVVGLVLVFALTLLDGTARLWVGLGLAAVTLRRGVQAPGWLVRPTETLARSSYYVFLLHIAGFTILRGLGIEAPAALFAAGTALGLAGWWAFDRARLPARAFARLRAAGPAALPSWRAGLVR